MIGSRQFMTDLTTSKTRTRWKIKSRTNDTTLLAIHQTQVTTCLQLIFQMREVTKFIDSTNYATKRQRKTITSFQTR